MNGDKFVFIAYREISIRYMSSNLMNYGVIYQIYHRMSIFCESNARDI